MITPSIRGISLLCVGLLFAACSGKGPDVVEPGTGSRSQTSILAIDNGAESELAIVKEPDAVTSTHAYLDANGAPLGRRIDGVFQKFNRLFLLHRSSGSITVVDLATQQKRAEITGFSDSDSGSALCGLAFSNVSQGWVIDHDRPFVFLIDAVNAKLVDSLPIEGKPTAVAASGNDVFVASQLPDGSGLVSVFKSNFTTFRIDTRLTYPSPIVFMAPNGLDDAMVLVSAGAPGAKPVVYMVKTATMLQSGERALNASSSLAQYIGTVPEFATVTHESYLYIAAGDRVFRLDVRSGRLGSGPQTWYDGTFTTIGADYWTDLVYLYDPGTSALKRLDANGDELSPLALPAPVTAIEFVNTSSVP
jgi:hypothetical protein